MTRYQQHAVDALFVITEAVAWFVWIRLLATATERGFMGDIEERLTSAIASNDLDNVGRAMQVMEQVRRASEDLIAGPGLLVVIAAGLGGFYLVRGVRRMDAGPGIGSLTMVLVSIVGLNVLLHLALAGDARIWDNSGLATFVDQPSRYFADEVDLQAFVNDPHIGQPHGSSLTVTFVGVVGIWLRFLVGARSLVTFERVLRSFSVGFAVLLVGVIAARAGDATQLAIYAVPHFVLGVLMLAVANGARAQQQPAAEGARRVGPWAFSVLATVGVLAVTASLLGLLAFLDVGRAVGYVLGIIGPVLGWLLVLVITPIFWVVQFILRLLLPEGIFGALENLTDLGPPEQPEGGEEQEEALVQFPGWAVDTLKALLLAAAMYGFYRIGRLILERRREAGERDYAEVREAGEEATGLGGLLRNLLPRRARGPEMANWIRGQPVYRLYARVVNDAGERGLRRRPGETPLEFSAVGERMLDAPVFEPIGEAFDRARYGRHFAGAAELAPLERELAAWEAAHPATDELRERIGGARQPDEVTQLQLRVEHAKRVARGDSEGARHLEF